MPFAIASTRSSVNSKRSRIAGDVSGDKASISALFAAKIASDSSRIARAAAVKALFFNSGAAVARTRAAALAFLPMESINSFISLPFFRKQIVAMDDFVRAVISQNGFDFGAVPSRDQRRVL